ncbi:MAG: UDP-N-acetylmuramate dehydrogenase [Atopobiaceae bacterium]|jgi:UDP-N-acetylmuramate dehydrogenase|nr:UDP-N-acetylmuramate dehydrogenase [Atopobiaceae bacterium]
MTDQPYDRPALEARLRSIVGDEGVFLDEPMREHTTFEVGGPADLFVVPERQGQVAPIIEACREAGAPLFVLGRGSDLLVSDAGYRGVVLAVADGLDDLLVEGTDVVCEAGVTLRDAAEAACALGLSGLEFACGIPGSVGGAVFMNAGAYDGQMSDVLKSVKALTPTGEPVEIAGEELEMGYRTSRVRTEGLVVLTATLSLEPGSEEDIRARMDDLTARREAKQPLEYPSAGSTFKRPEGHFAGKLVTDAGLKGFSVGGAMVSEKHAGFVINAGGASAADVLAVIRHVQDEVLRQFGVSLEPEVRMLGDMGPDAPNPSA